MGLVFSQPKSVLPDILSVDEWLFIFVAFWGLLIYLISLGISQSRLFLAWRALRDHRLAAEVAGINRLLSNNAAFAVSAMFAGISGALGVGRGHVIKVVARVVESRDVRCEQRRHDECSLQTCDHLPRELTRHNHIIIPSMVTPTVFRIPTDLIDIFGDERVRSFAGCNIDLRKEPGGHVVTRRCKRLGTVTVGTIGRTRLKNGKDICGFLFIVEQSRQAMPNN